MKKQLFATAALAALATASLAAAANAEDPTTIKVTRATFNLATPDSAQVQKVQDAINAYIADKINVQINLTDIGSGEYTDKANLALANNEINLLNAESDLAKAKADRGVSMSVYARFGLSQKDNTFNGAYRNPLDQEVVGMTFNIPIFDWGLGRGKIQKAKAAQEAVKAQVQQAENDFRRVIFTAVGQFNNQRNQCQVSSRARHIASERLDLMVDKFRSGNATVTDLNTAQSENDTAIEKYVTDISNYWKYYYTLRQYTLYDFIKQSDIDVDVMEMVEE